MKRTLHGLFGIFLVVSLYNPCFATQLSGAYTINPSTTASATVFNDFISAITYMNSTNIRPDGGPANTGTVGVSAAVTFNVAAGTTYTLTSPILISSITGASTSNKIIFKKSGTGTNPLIIGYSGTGSADGIVIFQGASFIIFDGIDVKDPSSNTSATTQMEWGYALIRTSAPIGSQYDTIRNCTITLNRSNSNTVGLYADCGYWASGVYTAITTQPSSFSGTNSYNGFYKNTISNCFTPIAIRSYASGAGIFDLNNDCGSKGGNIITSFGYQALVSPYTNTYTGAAVHAILFYQQAGTYYINNNNITLTSADNVSSTINVISSVAYAIAAAGSNPTIVGNTMNITSFATSGTTMGITNNQGTSSSIEDVENNVITCVNITATGAFNFCAINIESTIPSGKYIYNGNEIKNCNIYGTGYFYGLSSDGKGGPSSTFSYSGNKIHDNIRSNGASGDMYLIYDDIGSKPLTEANNQIYNNTNLCGNLYAIFNTISTSLENINNNAIYNLTTNAGAVTGIYLKSTNSTPRNIYQDSIANFSSTSGFAIGINIGSGNSSNIYQNKIYLPGGALGGMFLSAITGTSASPSFIANNFVTVGGTGALNAGIFDVGGGYHNYYYNSVLMTNTNASSAGFIISQSSSGAGVNFINNCSSNTGGGPAVYLTNAAGVNSMDYNNWYSLGSYMGIYSSTNISSLSAWQKASGFDVHSISASPGYRSNIDLHLSSLLLARAGNLVSQVNNDIDNKPRHPAPTIGANEILPLKTDIGVSAILSPTYGSCGDSFTTLIANVKNLGTDTQNNVIVTASVKMPTGATNTYNYTIKSKIPYDSIVTVIFPTTFNTVNGGTYVFKLYTSLVGDLNRANDTLTSVVTIYRHSPAPNGVGATICHYGTLKLTATANSKNDSLYWYGDPGANVLLGLGRTFITPPINTTTSYFVQERVTPVKYNLGPKSNAIGGTTTTLSTTGFKFNALNSFTIDSATIYPVNTGIVNITLVDSFGNKLRTVSVPVNVSVSGTPVTVPLGIIVTQGNGYSFMFNDSAAGGMYYNSTGAIYPYTVAGVASIISPTNGTGTSGQYYGLYNMYIRTSNCPSKTTQVNAVIGAPGATLKLDPVSAGALFDGTASKPDKVCAGSKLIYDYSTVLGDAGFGKTWTIVSKTLKTPKGTIKKDTSSTIPSTLGGPGSFTINTKSADADSTYILSITFRSLGKTTCDSIVQRYLFVSPPPVVKFGVSTTCFGNANKFTDSSTILAGSIYFWNWDFGDATTSTQQNPSHIYASVGKNTVSLTAVSDFGCSGSITKTMEVYPYPKAKYTFTTGCQNDTTKFIDASTIPSGTISIHKWYFGDGTTSSATNPIHFYSKSGPYTVKEVVLSSYGCKDSLVTHVKIPSKPVAIFSYINACVGSNISFSNTSVDSSNANQNKWDFGDGNTSTSPIPIHAFAKNGSYKVKLTVTSKDGCTDTVSHSITPLPKPIVNFFASAACTGKSVTFSDSGKNGNSALYNWTFGDGGSSTIHNNVVSHTYTKAGTYKAKLSINSTIGCTDSESKSIVIVDNPKAGFTTVNVCIGNTTLFTNTTTPTLGISHKWDFGDGSAVNTSLSPTHKYNAAGAYKVKYTATSSGGCTDTTSKSVNIYTLPVLGKWTASVHNFTVSFSPQDSTFKTYKWFFGTGDSSTSVKPVYVYPAIKASYFVKLSVTNTNGCSATISDSVAVGKTGINAGPGLLLNDIAIYPNPFNNKLTISYSLTVKSRLGISIFDMQGRQITIIKEGNFETGNYNDEIDASALKMTGGIYLLRMAINEEQFTVRIVNMKLN